MTAPHRPFDKERAYTLRLGMAAGLDPEQVRDLREELLSQGNPLLVIQHCLDYNREALREMLAQDEADPTRGRNYGGGIGRVHGFMRGACVRQREWLLADLIEMGHC